MASEITVELLKSKLHRAEVTGANVDYEGSLSIDEDLMALVGLLPYERLLCGNQANGARFETYVIPATRGSGDIILNGATARLGEVGDLLTIMTFVRVPIAEARGWGPRLAVLSDRNRHFETRPSTIKVEVPAVMGECSD
tara:strand:- start:217 stop:636 length:420 start_codon:yes stop_codon:yes gene_type:complete